MLNELFGIHGRMISKISLNFKRRLYETINWDQRMIIITGARGTGKTTLVLQHYLEAYNDIKECLLAVIYNDPVADNKTDPPQTINFYRQRNKYWYYN